MGGGASIDSRNDTIQEFASTFLRNNTQERNSELICSILREAHSSGNDLIAIRAHIENLLSEQNTQWSWNWGEDANSALGNDFLKVDGYSHVELCIYEQSDRGSVVDKRFETELVHLFAAFYGEYEESIHPLEITKVVAIHNPVLEESMKSSTMKIRDQITLGGAYQAHWRKLQDPEIIWRKERVLELLDLVSPSACVIGFAGQSDLALCKNICSNGFADLAKTDPGYFGRGVYLTRHSEYAALYASSVWWPPDKVSVKGSVLDISPGTECTIIAAYATPGVCYPITRNEDYTQSFCWCDLKGQGMKFGYHSHCVLVNRLRVLRDLNYQCMASEADPRCAYSELVLQHTAQALPRYVIQCRRKDDTRITTSSYSGPLWTGGSVGRQKEPEIFPTLPRDIGPLVLLYEHSSGPHWTVNTNWCKTIDIGTWMGPHYPVGLTAEGLVQRIRLPSNNLSGTIPREIGLLDKICILDLSENQLHGLIPREIGELPLLQELYLDKNSLHGDLHVSLILRKSKLARRCRVGGQSSLSDGKHARFSLPTLWRDHAVGKALSAMRDLMEVPKLMLSESSVTGILPVDMCKYFSTSRLDNEEDGTLLRHEGGLTDFDLSKNALHGPILAEIGLISTIQRLYLNNNNLTGPIPPQLTSLISLKDLNLSYNQLCGEFPSFISSFSALQNLNISNNTLCGEIPDGAFHNLTSLLRLEIGNNKFASDLPSSMSSLYSLILLSAESNCFTGVIPTNFSYMTSLRGLNLSKNDLHGQIPAGLAAIASLQRIELRENKLCGCLPEFSAYEKLRIINLGGNQFAGSIPMDWSRLRSLETVFLDGNRDLDLSAAPSVFGPRVEVVLR